jgi:hypothetical protein
MNDFINRLFGIKPEPEPEPKKKKGRRFNFTEEDFKSVKVKMLTYNMISDYAKRNNRPKSQVVFLAMNHLLNAEKQHEKSTNKSN